MTKTLQIRNVPDRGLALRELARVVRPGGRIAVLELNDPKEKAGCQGPQTISIEVVGRTYIPGDRVRINGVVIREPQDQRGFLNLDSTLYDRISRVDQSQLDDFIREGAKFVVEAFQCGQGNGVWLIDSISRT